LKKSSPPDKEAGKQPDENSPASSIESSREKSDDQVVQKKAVPEKDTKQTKPEMKPVKKEPEKKGKKEKAEKQKEDFKYIVRIADTDIDGRKTTTHGLTSIKGIGMHMSVLIADAAGIDRNVKIGDLTDAQVEKIQGVLENLDEIAPGWMLNHRKDADTGDDIHIVGAAIDMRLRDEINILKKIRSYRGIRHELGLPVRGQRTRANNRKGLALGVSRKSARSK
jgi:small subunit ribosomal protein S13